MRCIAIAAVTIDGKIALDAGHFSDWTSPEDKDFLHEMLDKSDVIVVGNNTYKTAIGPLSKRNCIVFTASVATSERKSDTLAYCNPASSDCIPLMRKYEKVAVLGGTQTYTWFLENDLLDELYLTIEPIVFGRGLNLFESTEDVLAKFHLESTKPLNEKGSVLLHYLKQ
ncbi:MAG: dihydrofolate reductase family protein [Patescibacteria group bacterium]